MKFPRSINWLLLAALPAALRADADTKPGCAPLSAWTEIEAKAAEAPATGYNHYRAALESRPRWKSYYATYKGWTAPAPRTAPAGKLANLSEKPSGPRFPLTPVVWPSKPGEASICLWEDDKVAAVSFGIDDNNAADVPAWLSISKKYGGLNITWNLISNNIDGVTDPGRKGSAGTWELWRSLLAQGYDMQSHSVSHVGDPVLEDGWPGPDWETAESQRQLEAGLPGHRVRLFVRPGSAIAAFGVSDKWRPSSVKYYAAARGASGLPINPANQIDYFEIHTASNPGFFVGEPDKSGAIPAWAQKGQLKNILDPAHENYRGWATFFIHNIGSEDRLPSAFVKVFEFFDHNRADLWIGRMTDVALYGEERDTATLKTVRAEATGIALDLTSRMDPATFDYPLTVKVRLPDTWNSVVATQAGKPAEARVLRHEGGAYVLVKARPDGGEILIAPGKADPPDQRVAAAAMR